MSTILRGLRAWLCVGALLGIAGWSAPARAAANPEATLEVAHRPVATFRSAFGGADAAARVQRADKRLDEARARNLPPEVALSPITLDGQRGMAFRQGDVLLFVLTAADIEPGSGDTLDQLAQRTLGALNTALVAEAEQRRWPVVLKALGLALVETALLLVLLWAVWRVAHGIEAALLRGLSEDDRSDTDLPAPQAAASAPTATAAVDGTDARAAWLRYTQALLARLVQLVALFFSAGLIYAWVTSVLLVFPGTQALGERLGGLFLQTVGDLATSALHAVPGLVGVAVILLLAQAAVQASNAVFRAVARRHLRIGFLHPETAAATRRLVALGIWALAVVAAYPYLPGSSSDVFKGVSVLLGAMVTLGSSGIVNQMMSGLVLVYSRALRVGDLVVIGRDSESVEGVVQEIGTLATKLKTMRNEEITIPNAVLVASPIRNFSRLSATQGTMMSTRVTIGYDAPWRQVHGLLLGAAAQTSGLRREPAPFVLQRALSDFYVEYELFAHLDKPIERPLRVSELHQHIQDAFNAAGVQIMSPHFMVQPAHAVLAPKEAGHG